MVNAAVSCSLHLKTLLAWRSSSVIVSNTRNCYTKAQTGFSIKRRDFLTLKDFSTKEIEDLLWVAKDLKTRIKDNGQLYEPLKGKSMAMIFQKKSTRTRLSTETGMYLLGGQACFLGPTDIHLGINETIADSARVLSRLCDVILARVYGHNDLDVLAAEASVPVINGLSDKYHPLQILADFLTLYEHFGYLHGLKVAWVGDGNNVAHSFLMGCPKMAMHLSVATPKGYECSSEVIKDALALSEKHSTKLKFTTDPLEAVQTADVIVTDTWVSMGQEEEKQKRLADFKGYQIDRKMLKGVSKNWAFLHCLPRKQEEVVDEVFYDKEHSLVWHEAENRKWTVMSVTLNLLKQHTCSIPKLRFNKT